jgi:hypothetical protein
MSPEEGEGVPIVARDSWRYAPPRHQVPLMRRGAAILGQHVVADHAVRGERLGPLCLHLPQ